MSDSLSLIRPDDWHVHLRDGDALAAVVPHTAAQFARAVVMPNLKPAVTTTAQALAYKQRIQAALPAGSPFQPLMTLYLTDHTPADEIHRAHDSGVVAVKLYPAGATTNSSAGVTDLRHTHQTLEAMQRVGMPLLVHGEVTDNHVDIFDREAVFIEQHLRQIVDRFPALRIVLEHITTADAVEFVKNAGPNVAATITPQHLLLNRNDMLVGGVRPHNYCLPVLKRRTHQEALRAAVATGSAKFFLGTDSAPHEKHRKESACGCAGCYSAHSAIELYAQVFDDLGCLDKLEGFASHYGADFYGLPRNTGTVTLVKQQWQVPAEITLPNGNPIVPFYAGETLNWKLV